MRVMLIKTMLLLMACLMMSSVASCRTVDQAASVTKGIDLCQSGIMPAILTQDDLKMMSHEQLVNQALLNCTLYKKCGFHFPGEKHCPK